MKEFFEEVIKLVAALAISVFSFAIRKVAKSFAKKYDVSTEFEEMNNLEDYIKRVVLSCVQSTNQTFVDTLKKQGKFDSEKKKEAFEITYNTVYTIVGELLKILLKTEDLKPIQTYLETLIEETVKMCKETIENEPTPKINVDSLMDNPTFTTFEYKPDALGETVTYEFSIEDMDNENISD
jgi:hypothetical protein